LQPGVVNGLIDAKHAGLLASGVTPGSPNSIKTYITQRKNYINGQLTSLNLPLAITSNDGNAFSTNSNLLRLTGIAPLQVRSIEVNGIEYPIRWINVAQWEIEIPLGVSTNSLTLQGFDTYGNLIAGASDQIDVTFIGTPESPRNLVVFNEIMYHPLAPNAEYVEIFSRATNTTFDLSSWKIKGADFTFPEGTLLRPGEYLVVAQDASGFRQAYGLDVILAGEFDGRLNNEGDFLRLIKPGVNGGPEQVIDEAGYSNQYPWPAIANGGGSSLQLIDPARDNRRVANWAAVKPESAHGPEWTRVTVTGTAQSSRLLLYLSSYPPVIDPRTLPGDWSGTVAVGSTVPVTVTFTTLASGELDGVLYAPQAIPLHNILLTNSIVTFSFDPMNANGNFRATLASDGMSMSGTYTESGQSYSFNIKRRITGGEVFVDDLSLVRGEIPEAGPNLIVNGDFENELSTEWNVATNHARSEVSSDEKNRGNNSLHLIAAPGGAAKSSALWQDLVGLQSGETYTLSFWYLPTEKAGSLVARLEDGSLVAAASVKPPIARHTEYTPGRKNTSAGTSPDLSNLWINEIQTANLGTIADSHNDRDPWIELYNAGPEPLSLDGFFLSDDGANLRRWSFPPVTLRPREYRLVWLDGEPGESSEIELHANFTPPAMGTLLLSRGFGTNTLVVDYMRYDSVTPDHSVGLYPNGRPYQMARFDFPTPGGPNNNHLEPVKVLINEWMAKNTRLPDPANGDFEDWFELYNASAEEVDLSGYLLTDKLANPTNYVIPAGTFIPAGGFLLVWADNQNPAADDSGALHANFKLEAKGEEIGLFTPDGQLVDAIRFGAQQADISQGRYRDGAGGLLYGMPPTPGASNILATTNTFPTLGEIGFQTVVEGESLEIALTGADAETPANQLRFSYDPLGFVPSAPIAINSESGLLSWRPDERDGPGVYTITVRVTDNGTPPLSAARTFRINVLESNQPPVLAVLANVTMPARSLLSFNAVVNDPDYPANRHLFTLSPDSPEGAFIDPVTGEFRWIPEIGTAQGLSNRVTVMVTDDGPNPLTDSKSFVVFVQENTVEVSVVRAEKNGDGSMTLTLNTQPGRTYQLQYRDAVQSGWINLGTPFVSQQSVVQIPDATPNSPQRFYRLLIMP
jgi:hypothetical protein